MGTKKLFNKYTRMKVKVLNYLNIHGRMTARALTIYGEWMNHNRFGWEEHKDIEKRIEELYEAAIRHEEGKE